MRKALFLIAALLADSASSAFADEADPAEMASNWFYEHKMLFTSSDGKTTQQLMASRDFAKHFPPHICTPRVNLKAAVFIMNCPAFWGSGQQVTLGFMESRFGRVLTLTKVKINGKDVSVAKFVNSDYTAIGFQALLKNPNIHVYLADDRRLVADLGLLQDAMRKDNATYCRIITFGEGEQPARRFSVDCPTSAEEWADRGEKVLSDSKTFQYTFELLGDNKVALIAGRTGMDHKLYGVEFISHAQAQFAKP